MVQTKRLKGWANLNRRISYATMRRRRSPAIQEGMRPMCRGSRALPAAHGGPFAAKARLNGRLSGVMVVEAVCVDPQLVLDRSEPLLKPVGIAGRFVVEDGRVRDLVAAAAATFGTGFGTGNAACRGVAALDRQVHDQLAVLFRQLLLQFLDGPPCSRCPSSSSVGDPLTAVFSTARTIFRHILSSSTNA